MEGNKKNIKIIKNKLIDFRILSILCLCDSEIQMELMAKYFRMILPNINFQFSCHIDSIIYSLDSLTFNPNNSISILIPFTRFSKDVYLKLKKYESSILSIYIYHNEKNEPFVVYKKLHVVILNKISYFFEIIKKIQDSTKYPKLRYDIMLKEKKYFLSIKRNMNYKLNLNNFSQKYLEYRDKTNIYSSFQNTVFLTLYDTYDLYLDLSHGMAFNQTSKDKIIKNLKQLSEFLIIFETNDFFRLSIFLKNLILLCINIFDYPYIYNSLNNKDIYNLLNKDFSELDTEEKDKKIKEIIITIEECCSYLVKKIEEKKCILLDKKIKELQIKLIEYYVINRKVKLNLYQIVFFFKDIDFCLKIFLYLINKNYPNDIFQKIVNSFMLIQIDRRVDSLIKYCCTFLKDFYEKYREFDDNKWKL